MVEDSLVPIAELAETMVRTHPERFDERYWKIFSTLVQPRLGSTPTVLDLGCGPGLFLHDLTDRLPGALMTGYDLAPEMIDEARRRVGHHSAASFERRDLGSSLPEVAPGGAGFITLNFFLHYYDWPGPLLAWVRQSLDPAHGVLQVMSPIRVPLRDYLAQTDPGDEAALERRMMLFPRQNRYTFEDLTWLLVARGFQVVFAERLLPNRALVLATPRALGKL